MSFECRRCGSTAGLVDLTVMDQGQHSDGRLQLILGLANPEALLFKRPQVVKINAEVCEVCGNIELRVADMDALRAGIRALSEQDEG